MALIINDDLMRRKQVTHTSHGGVEVGWRFEWKNGIGRLYAIGGAGKWLMADTKAGVDAQIAIARRALEEIEQAVKESYPVALITANTPPSDQGTEDAEYTTKEADHVPTS